MKAIIVDDEPKGIELIKGYLDHFNEIDLVGSFRNGLKAFEYLNNHSIDLIFLDINMPHISGISLSKMLDSKIKVIFTTAYSEYAVDSYEVAAIDYLLKPISLDRFMTAMGKVMDSNSKIDTNLSTFNWIKSGSRKYKLVVDDILYLHKEGNYITYYTKESKVVARESIAEALANLPSNFHQTHKSFIINLSNITAFERDCFYINGTKIPIGSSFKHNIVNALNKFNL